MRWINFRTTTFLFFLLLLLLNLVSLFFCPCYDCAVNSFCTNHLWYYGMLVAVYLVIPVVLSFFPCSLFHHSKVTCRINTDKKLLSITFDDGPDPLHTSAILDILQRQNIKATFFVIGKHVAGNEHLLLRAIREGHEIGNHSFSHSKFWDFMPAYHIREDIHQAEELVHQVTGIRTRLFRPPYGVINPMVHNAIRKTEYKVIAWSLRSFDTMVRDEQKLLKRISSGIKPGSIILLHDTQAVTVKILEPLIKQLKMDGYCFATLEETIKIKPYA